MSKFKAVAFIEGVPEIEAICKELDEYEERASQTMAFLKRQAEQMKEKFDKDVAEVWQRLGDYLVAEGKIPSFDNDKDRLRISRESNVVYYQKDFSSAKDDDSGMPKELKQLLAHLLGQ